MKRLPHFLLSALLIGVTTAPVHAVTPRQCVRKVADSTLSCTYTLIAMRSLQTAVEAYAIDKHQYPVAQSITELKSLVQPTYIVTTPLTDKWGTEFRYVLSADGKSYRIISAGSDKVFDDSSWGSPGLLESSKEDAVVSSNGRDREWAIQE